MEAAPRGGGSAEGGGGKSKQRSSEVIRRIHEETERVKRRLNESASQDQASDTSSQQGRRSPVSTPQRKAKSPAESFTDTYVQNYKNNNQQPPQQRQQQHQQQQFDAVSRGGGGLGTEAALDLPLRIAPEPSVGAYFEDPVPANQMSSHLKSEHEAFKAKLIDEVLGQDSGDRVPMEKVVMLIWQFRDDPQVVKFMTRFVAKFSGSRHVFDGIEFYLPQLAHMIIHLEAEWDDAILERFALVIAQQSLHFALQLNWILQGAIEDYQPELPDGSMNPDFQPLYYARCTKLLTNIERCVVYRRPRSAELQALYEKGKITKTELHLMEHADRRFNALQITGGDENEVGEKFGGSLLYKRTVRTACYKPKPWKARYCVIEDRMLNCFNSKGGRMVRSMPVEGATIEPDPNSKYYYTFVISNRSFEWRMRAANQEDHDKWIKALTEESNTTAVFGHLDSSLHKSSEDRERVVSEMTEAQRARYDFFRDERDFVRRVTDIAEELRFKEPPERKKLAPQLLKSMDIAPCVYSPLCNSTNIWRRVTGTFYADTRVFNTNERCPVIMYFLTARGEQPDRRSGKRNANLDVAEFIQQKFDGFEEENTTTSTIAEEDEKPFDEASREENEDPEKIVQAMYGEAANGAEEGDSSVWHDSILKGQQQTQGGNRALQRFLRESFVSIPRKLAKGLEGRRPSILANATGLQSVPIVEGDHGNMGEEGHKSLGDVSVGRSSVFGKQGVVLGDLDEGDIDMDSIMRAKQVVSGGESWAEKSLRMLEEAKKKPADAELEVVSLMSKSNDDLRQEVFVMQMIHYYKSVFAKAKLPIWLKTYRILSTSSTTGLIEVLVDATSLDGLKKADGYPKEGGMRQYFEETYGPPTSKSFLAAQQNFMQSLVGYSLVSYLLGLKDRHNGNIMIDTRAHLIQIDFGFAMGMAPGHEFSMERAPFKFTQEYLDVMGGPDSECFAEFKRLFVAGFKEARQNSQIALGLVEIMMYKSKYPCFSGSRYGNGVALKRFEKRLMLDVPDKYIEKRALGLLNNANNHRGTRLYDSFQQYSNGYAI